MKYVKYIGSVEKINLNSVVVSVGLIFHTTPVRMYDRYIASRPGGKHTV